MATSSLSVAAARQLASTTKTAPQARGITPRWFLRSLPWVATQAGVYRINRRLRYEIYDGRVRVLGSGQELTVDPADLCEMPLLRGFDDPEVLEALAGLFQVEQLSSGQLLTEAGADMDRLIILAHGRAAEFGVGEFGEVVVLRVAGDGDYFGDELLGQQDQAWEREVQALSACEVLTLSKQELWALIDASPSLAEHLGQQQLLAGFSMDKAQQPEIAMSSSHELEYGLAGTFVDYEAHPGDIELSVSQAVVRVSTRVHDLYSEPHDQLEHQLRLTIEVLRERQEHELVNNPEFGLLAGIDYKHRLFAKPGPPTPDQVDELVCRCRQASLLLAHPRAIAAFGRECNRIGVMPEPLEHEGQMVFAWRGIPMLPCDKLPVTAGQASSILCLRLGEDREGVFGLHQPGIPDELEPSLNVRFMGTDAQAVSSYLVSVYYSLGVMVPSAVNILEGVQLDY